MIKLITLYEDSENQAYSAIFEHNDNFIEVSINGIYSIVKSGSIFGRNLEGRPFINDLSEKTFKIVSETKFDSHEKAIDFFWLFIRDPDLGIMEGTL